MWEYRFCRGGNGDIVDIKSLNNETRHDLGPYHCLGCGSEMVPALGTRNAHHFRHKAGTDTCGRETYLHQAAKAAVAEGFQQAKEQCRPYTLRINHAYTCPISAKVAGLGCQVQKDQDLTAWYQDAKTEAGIMGFVADILLTDQKAPPLLVEIEVTHPCEPAKISSGLRIVEVQVRDEGDVLALRSGIDTTAPNVRTHGLSPKPHTGSCKRTCSRDARTFVLFKSGKTWLGMKSLPDLEKLSRMASVEHIEVVEGEWEEGNMTIFDVDPHVQRAAFELGRNVRSCLLCRHHGFTAGREGGQMPIWCYERKRDLVHNEAAQCPSFRRIASRDELDRKRERIAQASGRARDQWILDTMLSAHRR